MNLELNTAMTKRKFSKRMRSLLTMKTFWLITAIGNGYVLLGSVLFYLFERHSNAGAESYINCLEWAVSSVTGSNTNVFAATLGGKIISILLMMGGAFFL